MHTPRTTCLPSLILGLLASPFVLHSAAAEKVDFAHDVVPILKKHCVECHGGEKAEGGFSLNTRELILDAEAAAPGRADASRLIELLVSADPEEQMPPKDRPRLAMKDIETLRRWIDEGLSWEESFTFATARYEPPLLPRVVELPPASDGRDNPIDRILDAYAVQHSFARSEPLSDEAFLRRVSLDLIGLLPTPEQRLEFLSDHDPHKRDKLIDHLLADNQAYAEHWLTFWNDLLRNDYVGTGYIDGGRKQISAWLYQALVENKPYDQFVRELIAPTDDAAGFINGIQWRGTVNASQTRQIQFSQNVSQVFLGINMKCASCHDSFIDRWKLEEAYNLAAVYALEPLEIHRCDKPIGQTAEARWLFPELGQVDAAAPQPERLKQLAALLTHRDNGRFTRTIFNRLWQRLMGRGIVHPVDAMHTPPWNADLLDYLAEDLVAQHYDLKATLRLIVNSHAYQSPAVALAEEPGAEYVFRGPLAKRLTAEQFLDAIWQLTGAGPNKIDAPVRRGTQVSSGQAQREVHARWVWSSAEGSTSQPSAGEQITLRRAFELPASIRQAALVVTCDNEYQLFVNGGQIAADKDWPSVEIWPVTHALRAGNNEVVLVARNAGDGPNPAAALCEIVVTLDDGSELAIGTDERWEWTTAKPNGRGRFTTPPTDWQAAVPVADQGFLGPAVNEQVRISLNAAFTRSHQLVRASLVKSDLLMRALGRPNREQVVTTRPDMLTTLEAIDLANGQLLADTIARGASNLQPLHAADADDFIDWLYVSALSRAATEGERTIAREIVGQPPSAQGMEDLLWVVVMLPEFQLLR